VRTPLADGNIAVFANRWKLIDDDTLPDYLAFVRDHAGEARALVATPISQRMTRYRLLALAGRLVAAALTRWDVDVGPLPAHPRPPLSLAPSRCWRPRPAARPSTCRARPPASPSASWKAPTAGYG
jgi:hypothetical protein